MHLFSDVGLKVVKEVYFQDILDQSKQRGGNDLEGLMVLLNSACLTESQEFVQLKSFMNRLEMSQELGTKG